MSKINILKVISQQQYLVFSCCLTYLRFGSLMLQVGNLHSKKSIKDGKYALKFTYLKIQERKCSAGDKKNY
jgi:hypothetical protein